MDNVSLRPWRIKFFKFGSMSEKAVVAADDTIIFSPPNKRCEMDIEHLVAAVNAHDKMVEAIKKTLLDAETMQAVIGSAPAYAELREALKAAGEL